jgi:hypothetical protein
MNILRKSNQIFKGLGMASLVYGLAACQQIPNQIPNTVQASDALNIQQCDFVRPPIIWDLDPFDGDGDGINELAVFRPPLGSEPGHWYWRNELDPYLGQFSLEQLGVKGDWLVPSDYDGPDFNDCYEDKDDPRHERKPRRKTDIAIYRPPAPQTDTVGEWWIAYSNRSTSQPPRYSNFKVTRWGIGDPLAQPVPADYDGDGVADLAVWQPSTGLWRIRLSEDNKELELQNGGKLEDQPLAFDFDGDGKADPTIFNSSVENNPAYWRILESSLKYKARVEYFGDPKSEPYPANYDGDNKVDIAVYSLTNSYWQIEPSDITQKPYVVRFGYNSDIRIPGYYNDDNYADFAVFRQSERLPRGEERIGYWYVLDGHLANKTSDMIIAGPFGLDQDIPLKVRQIK